MNSVSKFIQILEVNRKLHALDEDGAVWIYHPAEGEKFAGWFKLTEHRVDTAARAKRDKNEQR